MERKSYFRMFVSVLGFLALAAVTGGMMFDQYAWFKTAIGYVSNHGAISPSFVAWFVIGMALVLTWMGVRGHNENVDNWEATLKDHNRYSHALTAAREHLALVHGAYANGDAKAASQLLQLSRDISLEELHIAAIRINLESAQRIHGPRASKLIIDAIHYALRLEKGWEPLMKKEHAAAVNFAVQGNMESLLHMNLQRHPWLRELLSRQGLAVSNR